MDERLGFVGDCLEGEETMTALCAAYGISRKTGYKWLGRYRALGPEGLVDLPRAPLAHGRATAAELVARIVAEKEAHPLWGPKKVLARLKRGAPQLGWPVASTVGEILKRHGLVGRRRRRWRPAGGGSFAPAAGPNAVWSGDYKGWFRTRDGRRCEPLTVMDVSSRFALALEACTRPAEEEAWPVFVRLFAEHGLPERFRSDNGSPFAAAGVTGLTPLSVRFIKLGIGLERISPGKPQQNGRHERFHLTMLPLAAAPEADRAAQQAAFDAFRSSYNEERPHEALDMEVPAVPALAAAPARSAARAGLSGRSGGAPGALQWRDQVERRPRPCLGHAGRRGRRDRGERRRRLEAPLPCPPVRHHRQEDDAACPPQRLATPTSRRRGGHQLRGGRSVTHVSGSICYPSIGWTQARGGSPRSSCWSPRRCHQIQ
ncbi:hypothetical protein AB395_00005745 (plasmid) [Sinorhizobium fredii CCBAU 45436]|nr:integrase core domain-containing protein [Sinorhizobium fredii]AWI60922.1 hypothetical protein AB395_00005745 [Sinorhizobium fredii CCBAU 45436]